MLEEVYHGEDDDPRELTDKEQLYYTTDEIPVQPSHFLFKTPTGVST
jgi:hypothetical protein